jgi:hypothetical protein
MTGKTLPAPRPLNDASDVPPPAPSPWIPPRACALAALVVVGAAGPARSEEPPAAAADALVAEGARLGGEGRLEEAILRFKAAEARFPRALHDCNIGLAYARLGRLPQAHWFLSRCQRRATEPLPEWVAPRLETTLSQLRAGPYAPVRIETSPQPAPVTISTFAPDESVSPPADVWLPQATEVVLTAHAAHDAAGGEARVRLPSPAPTRVLVEVRASDPVPAPSSAPSPASLPAPVPTPEAPFLAEPAPAPPESSPPSWPWWVAAGGGLAVVGGGLALASAAGLAEDARAANSAGRYDDLRDRAELRWGAGWALVGAGAVALGLGLTQAPWGSEDPAPR